tara:strand:+ start:77 stop:667 length:591 start_codon:yes stop_codon:yes gene_type:complete
MMQQGIMSKLDQLRNMGVESGPIGGPNNPESYPGQARERGNQTPVPREMLAGMGIESGPIGSPTNPESYPGQANDLMQDQAPEMLQQEQGVDAGQDAQMLADAVIKRSQGNPETALQIIEGAKGVIMQVISGSKREPQRMENGGPLSQKDSKLKPIPEGNKGLAKLPEEVRNNMGFMANGGELTTALNRLNYLRGN